MSRYILPLRRRQSVAAASLVARPSRWRRGIALVSVLFALAVVSTLLVGAFWVTTQEQRIGENARRQRQSFGAAQTGVSEIIRQWDAKVRNNLRTYPQDSVIIPMTATPSGTGTYSAKVMRFGTDVFLLDVTGTDNVSKTGQVEGTGARQRIGLMVRTLPGVTMKPLGAFAGVGKVKITDFVTVDGNDHIPAGFSDCPPLGAAITGFNTDTGAKVQFKGSAVAYGNPPTAATIGTADTIAMTAMFDSLKALANVTVSTNNITVAPVITDGACDISVLTNWGSPLDPNGPCGSYFPIVRTVGHVNIQNGVQGQGILIIDGDLFVKGKFTWVGIVLAEGKVKLTGDASGDPLVMGAVVSRKKSKYTQSTEDTLEGYSRIDYSKCAIMKAMRAARTTSVLRSRAWAQLF